MDMLISANNLLLIGKTIRVRAPHRSLPGKLVGRVSARLFKSYAELFQIIGFSQGSQEDLQPGGCGFVFYQPV